MLAPKATAARMPRILVAYHYYPSPSHDIEREELAYLERLRSAGFDVEGFCITLNAPGQRLSYAELDARWRRGDRQLMSLYERLEKALASKDVLLNEAGVNLHPDFIARLPVFTVFQCFDDPESSHDLSRPVASAYDLCLVGNVAEVPNYVKWGARRAVWMPLGLRSEIFDSTLTYEKIISGQRDIDLFMMADRLSPWRRERMERLAGAFPDAHFYGRGWPRGHLPADKERAFLLRSKIGPNLHNSTGPINYRLYYLPANGVMQICDNKQHLGTVFELGKEVIGFDTVEECIELCRYYLAHDDERRVIAANGWRRAVSDYNETAVFRRLVNLVSESMSESPEKPAIFDISVGQREATRWPRLRHWTVTRVKNALRPIFRLGRRRNPHLRT
jgi:spore maturation protein CgeB